MARFVPNPAAITAFMTDPTKPVMRALARKGDQVLSEARRFLSHSEWTGDLDSSLRVTVAPGRVGIGSDLPYVVFLHEGTGPAHITSDGGFGANPSPNPPYFPSWKSANFAVWSDDHGMNAYRLAQHVFLHGTQPNPFLRDALRAARF